VCGIHLSQGLGSSRTRGCLPGPDPTLNPHIAWYRKSKPVSRVQILPEKLVSGHNLLGAEQSALVGDGLLIALSVVKRCATGFGKNVASGDAGYLILGTGGIAERPSSPAGGAR
jgi:hypothetical protein